MDYFVIAERLAVYFGVHPCGDEVVLRVVTAQLHDLHASFGEPEDLPGRFAV